MKNPLIIYTDGGCWPNPGGIGGWGAIILLNGEHIELDGYAENTTNNRMEISGAIGALDYLRQRKIFTEVRVFTDSKYLVNGANQWMIRWEQNQWRRQKKRMTGQQTLDIGVEWERVKNDDLWMELSRLKKLQTKCTFQWIRGHNGDDLNERADQLAGDAAKARGADTDSFSQPHPKQAG